jgi:hypothetical protein
LTARLDTLNIYNFDLHLEVVKGAAVREGREYPIARGKTRVVEQVGARLVIQWLPGVGERGQGGRWIAGRRGRSATRTRRIDVVNDTFGRVTPGAGGNDYRLGRVACGAVGVLACTKATRDLRSQFTDS